MLNGLFWGKKKTFVGKLSRAQNHLRKVLNDLFWGKRNTFVGKYHFWVMNDHLWGPSVHVDKSFTKIQARVRPPPIPAMPGFWEFLFLEPLPKERTNFTWTVRFAQISLDLDAEIGDLLWFWVIFHICWICVKYLTNIMSEVGLLHLFGAQLSGGLIVCGPTERGPKCPFF